MCSTLWKGGKQGTGVVVYRFTADCREKKKLSNCPLAQMLKVWLFLWLRMLRSLVLVKIKDVYVRPIKCLFVFSSHCTTLKFQSSSCIQIQCGFCLSRPFRQQQQQQQLALCPLMWSALVSFFFGFPALLPFMRSWYFCVSAPSCNTWLLRSDSCAGFLRRWMSGPPTSLPC